LKNIRIANFFGGVAIPVMNKFVNNLLGSSGQWRDATLQNSKNVYPGEGRCSRRVSHAKWHEVIYSALADALLLTNDAIRIIRGSGSSHSGHLRDLQDESGLTDLSGRSNLLDCYLENDCFSEFNWAAISDQTSIGFESCIVNISKNWSLSGGMEDFMSCMVSFIIETAVNEEVSLQENATGIVTLDHCLVANNCLGFTGTKLNQDKLGKCLGFGKIVSIYFLVHSHFSPCFGL
jgi:hypothetical protein